MTTKPPSPNITEILIRRYPTGEYFTVITLRDSSYTSILYRDDPVLNELGLERCQIDLQRLIKLLRPSNFTYTPDRR